ncbi:MAG: hypothetical protein DCC75_12230, partial [Proteobacteria bacterium]
MVEFSIKLPFHKTVSRFLSEIKQELEKLSQEGRRKELIATAFRGGGLVEFKGKKLLDFTNWDALDLNQSAELKRASQMVIESAGIGAGSSRTLSGSSAYHARSEFRISKFLGMESALVFSSKNQAVFSLLTAMLGERDVIFFDELTQSPVIDAAYLVGASAVAVKSGELAAASEEVQRYQYAQRRFLYIESLSPLTGRKSNLPSLWNFAAANNLEILLDESYALGLIGARGAGVLEEFCSALLHPPLCVISDLSLAIGCYGACIAGSHDLISYLINRSRTLSHESALPPALMRSIEAALDILELKLAGRQRLLIIAKRIAEALGGPGYLLDESVISPIVSVTFKGVSKAFSFAEALFQRGVLVDVIPYSAPLADATAVRFLPHVSHTERQIGDLMAAISDIA